ncbi:L-2-aminoadipate reductase [Sphaceloma murrayae]|uniref:L-2-aminoadipate reductase n=1 Tax=Sphaceloma murrayae TaxID=2082308 RepID=A0A2K1QVV0_9PEZI|nr:L-2-aminoadipate reductase [Sphaceloma murrayae]
MSQDFREEPIAIIGTGCRLAGDTDSPSKLWQVLRDPRDLATAVPPSRFNAAGFYHKSSSYHGHSNVQDMKSYYLSTHPVERQFDAAFFGINTSEAHVLDPQLRLLMETTYEALESAGLPMEVLQGSDTGCYVGLMIGEYEQYMMRDPESIGQYHVMGTARSLMANRLSYFFDWHGPSMTIDTACSSSLVALHQGVQLLRSGHSKVAVAAGSNLILDPITHISESKLQMLSPDGKGRMWDAGANGYARGEGVAAVVMKRLSDALADGDHIEVIVRETGINQDGKTKGITLPSASAQAKLIQATYKRAGLDLKKPSDRPQYFEAHGTGTPAGDPIEAEAIHSAFFGSSSELSDAKGPVNGSEILHVGSIKTIYGHTEGTAGIAAVLRASLALQNSTIPPNMLFKSLNPRIKPFSNVLRIPTSPIPWPSCDGQSRRASVNSFGFGGTNTHAILESHDMGASSNQSSTSDVVFTPFVFSAASEKSLKAYLGKFSTYVEQNRAGLNLRNLAYSLHSRRSRLQVTTSLAASSVEDLLDRLRAKSEAGTQIGVRAQIGGESELGKREPNILGVFTGQGAQWPAMGAQLLSSSKVAARIFAGLEERLQNLPQADRPTWSLRGELVRLEQSRIGQAELSQPLCTAVQIVLVDLLRASGVKFSAVVGHSSGEIAAAYAVGILSADDAICIAYYRGLHGKLAVGKGGQKGAMMAAGITPEDATELLDSEVFSGRANIAAYNSSDSLTLSGDSDAIEELKEILEDEDKFARILKVEKAYHSHHMVACAQPYAASLEALNIRLGTPTGTWISSVSGKDILDHGLSELKSKYWIDNAVNPVLFMQAVQQVCSQRPAFDLAIEVGPHPALQSPATQTIKERTGKVPPYTGLLKRGQKDIVSLAEGLGLSWTHLARGAIDLQAFDHFISSSAPVSLVKTLPTYAWDHDTQYWHESRSTGSIMTRKEAHVLLGHVSPDNVADHEMRWRQILSPAEITWLAGHRLQSQIVFPAAGYVVLAIEAARELLRLSPDASPTTLIHVCDINIHQAMTFDNDDSRVEAVFALAEIKRNASSITANFKYSAASIGTNQKTNNTSALRTLTSGRLEIQLGQQDRSTLPARGEVPDSLLPVKEDEFYESLQTMEYEYSGLFRALSSLRRKLGTVVGLVSTGDDESSELMVHPGMLDAAFQAVLLAKSAPYDGSLWSMHVPKTIDRVTVNPFAWESFETKGKRLPLQAFQRSTSTSSFKGDVDIYPCSSNTAADDQSAHALLQVEGLDCVPFSPATVQDDKELLSTFVWDIAFPDARTAAYDLSTVPDQDELALAHYLERLAFYYLQCLDRAVPVGHTARNEDQPLSRLFGFFDYMKSRISTGKLPFWREEWYQDSIETLTAAARPFLEVADYKLLKRIGDNLINIVLGRITAIEAAREDDLLNEFYPVALGMSRHTVYLARLVKQITYRFPHLHILELGAGTAGATKAILRSIGDGFGSYIFTDISSGFFPKAREYFESSPWSSRINYKVLDISKDPEGQGFATQGFDLIIASQVLHATPVMKQSIKHVRKLLKPGGFLVVNEGINNDTARLGTIFGAFPGWWLGAQNDGRFLGPNLAVSDWDELLKSSGFSGVESSVPVIDPLLTPNTVFITQALDARMDFLRHPRNFSKESLTSIASPAAPIGPVLQEVILLGGTTEIVLGLIKSLEPILLQYFDRVVHIPSIHDIRSHEHKIGPQSLLLSLTDLDKPLFEDLSAASLENFIFVLHTVKTLFWVTHGRRAERPTTNMTIGAIRTALLEIPTLSFQTVEYEDLERLSSKGLAEDFLRFIAGLVWAPRRDNQDSVPPLIWSTERELVVNKEGSLLIPRLLPNRHMNDRYNSARRPIFQTQSTANQASSPGSVKAALDAGRETYCFERVSGTAIADPQHSSPTSTSLLKVVQIQHLAQKVSGIGHGHLALARDAAGSYHLVISEHISADIPAMPSTISISLDGIQGITKALEAKACLLHMMSLNLLAMEILETCRAGERILAYELDLTFASILKRAAKEREVDVVLVTSSLPAGRAKLLGWVNLHSQSTTRRIQQILPETSVMLLLGDLKGRSDYSGLASRIGKSLHSVQKQISLGDFFLKQGKLLRDPLTMGVDARGRLDTALRQAIQDRSMLKDAINTIPASQLATLSSTSTSHQPIILDWETVGEIDVRVRPVDQLDLFSNDKTYWLAGLTGSLGLSLCEWMLDHGAKHILMTSRNPKISQGWLQRVTSRGAVVQVHSVDLTDEEATSSFHNDITSVLPPIGGVASGAMVLRDTTLRNMSLDDMLQVCRPKVLGTTVLDKLFHDNPLDFFIVFSSLTAVTGNPGQANYSAANLFMSALVEQRRQRGLPASVIHIAPILGVGYVSEKSDRTKTNFPRTSGYSLTAERDFHQLFGEAVLAGGQSTHSGESAEIVLGIHKVPSNPKKLPYWYDDPMATHFILNSDSSDASKTTVVKASAKALLATVTTKAQASKVLTDAIKPVIVSLFQLTDGSLLDDLEFLSLRLDDIGLDSLLAVELRAWWLKTVQVNLPVMKLLSGITVEELIQLALENLDPGLIPHVNPESESDGIAEPADEHESSLPATSTEPHSSSNSDGSGTPETELAITPASETIEDFEVILQKPVLHETEIERWADLSFSQTMFWFVLTYLDDKTSLNHTGLYRMTGPIQIPRLEEAVIQVGQQHEALRVCFQSIDDRVRQGVMRTSQLRLEHRRISTESEAVDIAEQLQNHKYDVGQGECLRIILLELSPTVHFLLYGTHSLVMDGISGAILTRSLLTSYNEASQASNSGSFQYLTFADSQLESFRNGKMERSLRFWRKKFASCPAPLPVLRISTAMTRPAQTIYQNLRADLRIPPKTRERIKGACRQMRVRPFHFCLTVFRALLCRLADTEEICIGIVDANRAHEGALETIGPFINLLPLRFNGDFAQKFEAALRETKYEADEALKHQDVPFQALLNDLGLSRSATHSPLFQAFFDYRQGMPKRQRWGDCDLELLSFQASKLPYDVSLDIIDDAVTDEYHLMLIVRADMYSEQDAELLLKCYQRLLQSFADDPSTTIAEPQMFDQERIDRALGFGRGDIATWSWPYESVLGRIYSFGETQPDDLALKLPFGGETMTYGAMIAKAQAIAARLQAEGVSPNSVVATFQEATPNWLCSVLGIFSAGAICAPFDGSTIPKRLIDMAIDSRAVVFLVDKAVNAGALQQLGADPARKLIDVDEIETKDTSTTTPFYTSKANDPAMLLYTSGSTGTPKGIVLNHGGFRNWSEFMPNLYRSGGQDVVLTQSSCGFDMSYLQSFFALCHGGTVCICPRAFRVDAEAITKIIAEEGVTVTCGVPSEYTNWLRFGDSRALSRAKKWRTAMCGGEPGTNVVLELQASLGPQPPPRFFHIYGPTEITFIATGMELIYGSGEKTPAIGYPFPNYSVYVLDGNMKPVPPGFQGEIYVGGAGVAAGYLHNPGMTAEKFLPDPFAPANFRSQGWTTMHKTGDNGRWREDGALLIEGRKTGDTQHKLRGLRIDLQEIEKVLVAESSGLLTDAVVSVLRPSPQRPELLVAHVRFDTKSDLSDIEQKRTLDRLSAHLPLPQYMWPAIIVPIVHLPMMASGKLDRRAIAALPLPESSQSAEASDMEAVPLTDMEAQLKHLWEEVISKQVTQRYRIGPDTDFFRVGGTSMLLLRLQAKIKQTYLRTIPFVAMFEASTLGAMAKCISDNADARHETYDWNAETRIAEPTLSLISLTTPVPRLSTPQVVVLTGATGVLGRALLAALIANPTVTKIHCVAIRRLSTRLSSDPLLKHAKVQAYEGDLETPSLGLSKEDTRFIFGSADTIVHNGADTSHMKSYASVRAANLYSTKELVAMCVSIGRRVPIEYVSTASVLQFARATDWRIPSSAALYAPPPDVRDGYSSSKWASERFLERISEESGWEIGVHRISAITGEGVRGGEVVPNLVRFAEMLKAVPIIEKVKGWINFVELGTVVDKFMKAVVAESQGHDDDRVSKVRYYHQIGETGVEFAHLDEYVASRVGTEVRKIEVKDWVSEARGAGMDPVLAEFFNNVESIEEIVWPRLQD